MSKDAMKRALVYCRSIYYTIDYFMIQMFTATTSKAEKRHLEFIPSIETLSAVLEGKRVSPRRMRFNHNACFCEHPPANPSGFTRVQLSERSEEVKSCQSSIT
jgi:hypothetical protein